MTYRIPEPIMNGVVAGARFGHLLILLGEPEVEVTLERGRAEVGRAD